MKVLCFFIILIFLYCLCAIKIHCRYSFYKRIVLIDNFCELDTKKVYIAHQKKYIYDEIEEFYKDCKRNKKRGIKLSYVYLGENILNEIVSKQLNIVCLPLIIKWERDTWEILNYEIGEMNV